MKPVGSLFLLVTLFLALALTELSVAQSTKKAAAKISTGPEVGEKIPEFKVVDHRGRAQTFESLKGPKGLLLLFSRSADW